MSSTIMKAVVAAAGVAINYLYGGMSTVLGVLFAFVIADYITGLIAAGAEGQLSSKVGLIGIGRKVFIFLIVALAHLADTILGENNMIQTATIYFYLANELLSILENGGRIGVPIPPVISQAVAVLKGKGGNSQ